MNQERSTQQIHRPVRRELTDLMLKQSSVGRDSFQKAKRELCILLNERLHFLESLTHEQYRLLLKVPEGDSYGRS